jgi:hypothetical protein
VLSPAKECSPDNFTSGERYLAVFETFASASDDNRVANVHQFRFAPCARSRDKCPAFLLRVNGRILVHVVEPANDGNPACTGVQQHVEPPNNQFHVESLNLAFDMENTPNVTLPCGFRLIRKMNRQLCRLNNLVFSKRR